MNSISCRIGLEQHGYQELPTTFRDVNVYVDSLGSAGMGRATAAVAVVSEELAATFTTWQLMNMKNEIAGKLGTYRILFLVFTWDAELTGRNLAGDGNHWIYDRRSDRLRIYEDQPQGPEGGYEKLEHLLVELREQCPPDPDGDRDNFHRAGGAVPRTRRESGISRRDVLSFTVFMVIINLIVYLVDVVVERISGWDVLQEYGALYANVPQADGQYYRLFTSMFLHSGISHITGNMISLLFIGISLERVIGHWRMAVIYTVGGLVGSVVAYIYYSTAVTGPVSMVGASGAVFAAIGAYVYVLIRNRKRINRTALPRLLIYIALSIYMGATTTGISLSAHIGGLLGGFALAAALYHPTVGRR